MKYPALLLLASLGCAPGIDLQAAESAEIAGPAEKEKTLLTTAQLDELLAPIALYPDPLVAIILPASTFPTEVVMAARYLKANGDPEAIDDQPWDDSVKALARYPDVVKWMDENLAWTQQVGAAFLVQPSAVLTGTQRLRAAAVAAGNLKNTPQQTVVVEKEVIRIVPAEREVIYVPVYDPVWVYRPRPVHVYHSAPLITFSVGYRAGVWLSYGCDWGYKTVVVVNRPQRSVIWHSYPSCHYPRPVVVEHCHAWRPAPARVQIVRHDYERRADYRVSRPTPNAYVQRAPERGSPPRAVASTGSAMSSPRPAARREVAVVPSPASSARPVPAATTPSTRPERVREPRRQGSVAVVSSPAVSTPRPTAPAPAVVRNEATARPASTPRPENIARPAVSTPANPRPERVRTTAPVQPRQPVQIAETRARGNATPAATASGRRERIRVSEPAPTLPSGSSHALPLPGMATSAEIDAARAR